MDTVFEDFINEELLIEAAASWEAYAMELAHAPKDVTARIEAELGDEDDLAEPFSFRALGP